MKKINNELAETKKLLSQAEKYIDELSKMVSDGEERELELEKDLNALIESQLVLVEGLNIRQRRLEKIKEYVVNIGIDHKWDMRFQRWKSEILKIYDGG